MMRARATIALVIAAVLWCEHGTAAVGAHPYQVEEIRIGGGPAEPTDGGLEVDKAGQLDTSGYLSGASLKLRNGSYRATITWPTATTNRSITLPDASGEITLLGQTIDPADLADGAVTTPKLANGAVTSAKIADGTIVNADIAANAAIAPSKLGVGGGTNGQVLTLVGGVWTPAAPAGLSSVALSDITQSGATTNQVPVWSGSAWVPISLGDAHISDTLTASIFKGSGSTTDAVDLGTAEVAGTLPANMVGNGLTDAQVSDTLTASIFKGSGSTTDAVDLGTAEVAGTLPLAKLSTGSGTNGQILTLVGGVWTPTDPASASGVISGPGPLLDNAIPRMNGTGGYTLDGYPDTSLAPTIDDDGYMVVRNGFRVQATTNPLVQFESLSGGIQIMNSPIFWYRGGIGYGSTYTRHSLTTDTTSQTGALGGNALTFRAYDNTGNFSHDTLTIWNDPSYGVLIRGTAGTPRNVHIDGNLYMGTGDTQVTSSGKILLSALAQTSATTGQTLAWNGTTWAPSNSGTGNVINNGSAADNRYARFDGDGQHIQESQTTEDDSGNVTIAGKLNTAASSSSGAGFRLPHGSAPSSPANGDIWTTTGGLYARINGATVGPFAETGGDPTGIYAGDTFSGDVTATLESDGDTPLTIAPGAVTSAKIADSTIVDADISASAAIAASKIGNGLTDAQVNDALTISGGTINNTSIGATTASTGKFTTLQSTGNTTLGDDTTDQVTVSGGSGAFNTTTPGTGKYGIFLKQSGTNGDATGITFESNSSGTPTGNAQAGIYVVGSGTFGTNMYIATTDSHGTGAKNAIKITESGAVTLLRTGDLTLSDASSELKIMESSGGTYYGIFDVGDLSTDRTYTFPDMSGTVKTRTPVWIGAAALWPTTSSGCTAAALDSNDRPVAAFAASQNGVVAIPIPADYDGTTDRIALNYYRNDTSNAITWSISVVTFADGTAMNTAYDSPVSFSADTPGSGTAMQQVTVSSSGIFGAASNAGRVAMVKISTNGFSGANPAYFYGLEIEW